jgi:hypothetical protein
MSADEQNAFGVTQQLNVTLADQQTNPSPSNTTALPPSHTGGSSEREPWPTWTYMLMIMVGVCSMMTFRRRRRPPVRRAQEERERRERIQKAKEDPDKRARLIKRELVSKKVTQYDKESGHLMLGNTDDEDGDMSESIPASLGGDDLSAGHEHSSECVVCMEPFRVGDVVSWSNSMKCLHVFHNECITEWLQHPKHDDCPYCRCELVNTDEISLDTQDRNPPDGNDSNGDDDEEGSTYYAPLAWIVVNGLITRARQAAADFSSRASHNNTTISVQADPPPPESIALRRTLSEGMGYVRHKQAPLGTDVNHSTSQLSTPYATGRTSSDPKLFVGCRQRRHSLGSCQEIFDADPRLLVGYHQRSPSIDSMINQADDDAYHGGGEKVGHNDASSLPGSLKLSPRRQEKDESLCDEDDLSVLSIEEDLVPPDELDIDAALLSSSTEDQGGHDDSEDLLSPDTSLLRLDEPDVEMGGASVPTAPPVSYEPEHQRDDLSVSRTPSDPENIIMSTAEIPGVESGDAVDALEPSVAAHQLVETSNSKDSLESPSVSVDSTTRPNASYGYSIDTLV